MAPVVAAGAIEAGTAALANPEAATTIANAMAEVGAGDALGGTSLAAAGASQTFEILDGVRRAKAADMIGNMTIPAEVLNSEGRIAGRQDVPISNLLSPKPTIDVSTAKDMSRFMSTLDQTRVGSTPPPILVAPGVSGIPIRRVTLDQFGP
jgi:hypothetical protein